MASPPKPLLRWPAWVLAMSSAMAVAYPIADSGFDLWVDDSPRLLERPLRLLLPALGAVVLAAAQLLVLRPWIRSTWGWITAGTVGWTGAVLGAPVMTIGLPPFVTIETVACFASLVGAAFLGVLQLPWIARDLRGVVVWLAASTLSGPALVAGFWLAGTWTLGDVASGALGGIGYGVVSGLGLAALRRLPSGIASGAPVAVG